MSNLKVVGTLAVVVLLVNAGLAVVSQRDHSMREKILSSDFKTANQALDENRKGKKAELVRLSLEHPSLLIKRDAAAALRDLGDKDSVAALVETLEKNQVTLRGGSETKVLQQELDNEIVSALRELTGQNFPDPRSDSGAAPSLKTYSPDDLKQIIQASKKWLAETKQP